MNAATAQHHLPDGMASNLGIRMLSAVVLIPPVIASIHFGTPYFEILLGIGAIILVYELYSVSDGRLTWTASGTAYVGLSIFSMVLMRAQPEFGAITLYWLFVLVWSSDTVAYFVGRSIGGPKLAPKLSPNKTWSGFFGAMLGAGLAGGLVCIYLGKTESYGFILLSACLGAISQCGDLLESWFKRRFHRKDISNLIPGHGGLFDRVDGLLAAACVCGLMQLLSGRTLL